LAASAAATLKELGYQIDKTGNAPKQNVEKTEVRIKESAKGLDEGLLNDLRGSYDATLSGTLKDADTADAEVILGGK
jgi:hypothetical protein